MLQFRDNTKKYIKMLKKKHGALSIVGSQTVNQGAQQIKNSYDKSLENFTLRNKFTKGAVKLYKSSAQRKSGEFRKITGINAKVGIMKLRGGKDHYLLLQEKGGTKSGVSETQGKVPIPIDVTARKGGSHRGVVKGPLQLQKAGKIQTLNLGGKPFGFPGDGFGAKGGAQRWAILHKYSKRNRYGWDLKKQFFFTGQNQGLGIFKIAAKNRIHMVRTLEKSTIKIKPTYAFQKSVNQLSRRDMDKLFIKNARAYMGI